MDLFLFVVFVLLSFYGFFLTSLGRDLLKTGLAALTPQRPTTGRPGRAAGGERQRFGGRSTFGLRQR